MSSETTTTATTTTPDYYTILNIPYDASEQQIKRAFHHASLQHHPDKLQQQQGHITPEQHAHYLSIQAAWGVLGDEVKKKEYDAGLSKVQQQALRDEQAHYTVSIDDFQVVDCEDEEDADPLFQMECRCLEPLTITAQQLCDHEEGAGSGDDASVPPMIVTCPGCSLRYKVML